jgi:thioredoxin 1
MAFIRSYAEVEPSRAEIDAHRGDLALEFGAPWCGHCIAAQPLLESALAARDDIAHLKIEDGRGRPLGRSFRVKLWPTLILLRGGEEVARVVRPSTRDEIERVFSGFHTEGGTSNA